MFGSPGPAHSTMVCYTAFQCLGSGVALMTNGRQFKNIFYVEGLVEDKKEGQYGILGSLL